MKPATVVVIVIIALLLSPLGLISGLFYGLFGPTTEPTTTFGQKFLWGFLALSLFLWLAVETGVKMFFHYRRRQFPAQR